ncbi:MAG TPA: hypothetical protein P5081_10430 [Phycisphaerae bacterium]|nr:hypothetical protein [Phycisphaerae bacterium]HRW53293.1 hypothetical protein [Phycisphaerae bacterium]
MNHLCRIGFVCVIVSLGGCSPSETQKTAAPNQNTSASNKSDAATPTAEEHGTPIELGKSSIGAYDVRASRDEGAISPGGDAPIDVWLTGDLSGVLAVRFWIGTKTGEESIKALAGIENKDEPNHWHTHAEVPDPLPAGSQLWVEIETEGATGVGMFELKM